MKIIMTARPHSASGQCCLPFYTSAVSGPVRSSFGFNLCPYGLLPVIATSSVSQIPSLVIVERTFYNVCILHQIKKKINSTAHKYLTFLLLNVKYLCAILFV